MQSAFKQHKWLKGLFAEARKSRDDDNSDSDDSGCSDTSDSSSCKSVESSASKSGSSNISCKSVESSCHSSSSSSSGKVVQRPKSEERQITAANDANKKIVQRVFGLREHDAIVLANTFTEEYVDSEESLASLVSAGWKQNLAKLNAGARLRVMSLIEKSYVAMAHKKKLEREQQRTPPRNRSCVANDSSESLLE